MRSRRASLRARRAWLFAAALVALGLVAGCRAAGERPGLAFLPEMFESVAYDSYDPNPVTGTGQTLLLPPEATVPVGFEAFPFGPGPEEAARAGQAFASDASPAPESLARGKHVYDNVCIVCHGPAGQGDGSVVGLGRFPNPPSLTAHRARALGDGQIVHIVTYGQGLMPSLAAQVRLEDRFKVALHVRRLQAAASAAPGARP